MHIGLDPEIARIGSLSIGWHGVLMFIGIAVGLALTLPLARKLGIKSEITYTAAIWAVVFGFIYLTAKYLLPKIQPGTKGKYIEVIDKVVIEPSVTAYIIKAANIRHLVIVSGKSATVLGKVEGDLENAK